MIMIGHESRTSLPNKAIFETLFAAPSLLFSYEAICCQGLFLSVGASVAAQSSPVVVCVAGQCIEGFSNVTIGATLSASGAPTSLLLLPGQYASSTGPQLLHSLLTSPSASLTSSPGIQNLSSTPLPLNVALEPGLVVYSQTLYSGNAHFAPVPSVRPANASEPLSTTSLALSADVWVAVNTTSNSRLILWDSIPDFTQLPSGSLGPFSLLDIQSSACSPPCAGSGVCSPSGTCSCAPGFTGTSCQSCSPGFFGPNCQSCPTGCSSCDDGTSGTGRCLTAPVVNPPSSCNCINGICGSNGQCTCNTGFTTASNGTACAACAPGFFLTSAGNCEVCALGCTECAGGTGNCLSCKTGFTQSANDPTQCDAVASVTSTGTVCPDGSFSSGSTCAPCSPLCQTCSGGSSNNCIICGSGRFSLNGSCVLADSNGVCEGTELIANNNKHECDSCGAKCTSCVIPNFNVASTINELQCTGCLPGFVLSQGNCVGSCPAGTFLSPQDNLTCTACGPSCSTCAGSSTFCLTCANNQLASNGGCVSTCPSNTFSSSGACLACHPDCSSCSGPSFNQCSSCNSNRPVLSNGRCLATCSQSQFFDVTSSTCQSCDPSCSSCSGSGPNSCLACSGPNEVLRGGSCVSATCTNSSSVISNLGVCLSDLVQSPSGTSSGTFPSITGLTSPVVVRRPLAWWQVLLMTLGCAFIFVVILMCWRRRARKQRAKQTAKFVAAKSLDKKLTWRWRLARFGERLFGHEGANRADGDDIRLTELRRAEEARQPEIEKLMGTRYLSPRSNRDSSSHTDMSRTNSLSAGSLYSQATGVPRRTPEPRQPVKRSNSDQLPSRFSLSSFGSSTHLAKELLPPLPTEAESYARAVSGHEVERHSTGGSRNPFRI